MVAPARGRFVVPEHIRGHHDAAIGNFGVPDYGGTLTGVVLYPDKKATGCTEFPARFKSTSGRPVVLLLEIDRFLASANSRGEDIADARLCEPELSDDLRCHRI
ncbi:vacuolar-sorting receptor 1 [Aegilops tauschii subsp. strangulata]|uniref:vacuolar-sorting receptor 1 n=1 Tax=Aegilops tauschii subsp. strangulata TaxID=200361 RepID=UPI00098A798A|nr:vacuolar-sorting receptor 1 [Aegilops tauschii subsp. strangulata]